MSPRQAENGAQDMMAMGDGSGGFGSTHDETVADAMVTVETAVIAANKRHREFCSCNGPVIFDWEEVLAWTPKSESAEFASANGL